MVEDKIAAFVRKKRVIKDVTPRDFTEEKTPWYKRPLKREEFKIRCGKDERYYVRHDEWSKRTYIGPYFTRFTADKIINSYITESLKGPLSLKPSSEIHSVIIDDENFFRD